MADAERSPDREAEHGAVGAAAGRRRVEAGQRAMEAVTMRVLVGTDGSSSAGLAVDLAAGLAWPDGSTIHIVHAIDLGPALFAGPWPTVALTQIDDIERRLEGYAREELDVARERSTKPGVQVRTTILRGRAATAIVEAAGADRADLIIVGSRGHGAIESMLLGSVSEEVVDQAAVSVLIARRATASRVVLAWDGSPGGRAAADAVRTWPIFAGAAVRVVSVAESGSRWWTGVPVDGGAMEFASVYLDAAEASRADHEELARSLARELQEQGLTADW
jgi:nucleotide-binding universal stress UspA family protein